MTDLIAAYAYPDPVPARGWVRASMIHSLDGAATGADGLSGSLGTEADRAAFAVLRGLADTILVGRGTAEAEGYELPQPNPDTAVARARLGQAATPTMAIVSGSAEVPSRLWDTAGEQTADSAISAWPPLVVFTTASGDAAHGNDIRARWGPRAVQVSTGATVDLAWAVSVLVAHGQRRILCEGGPTLMAAVLHAACLDEVCVNIAPYLLGRDIGRIVAAQPSFAPARLQLAHAIAARDTVLTRWTVQRS